MQKYLGSFVLSYLRFFAKLQIAKLKFINPKLKVIGITGSAGKTSTIEAIVATLQSNYRLKTTSGYNSESGIPLSILNLKIKNYSPINWAIILLLAPISLIANWQIYDILILEMAIDSQKYPKNMDFLLSIVKPDIGVLLNVSSVHLQNFDSLESIAKEKSKLINSLPQNGFAIINPDIKKYIHTQAKIIEIKPYKNNLNLPQVYDLTLGVAAEIAKIFNIKPNFSKFVLPSGRFKIFKGINNSTIIDSTYNSSPIATIEMLKYLSKFKTPRVAILGDMRELGTSTTIEHQKIYEFAKKSADIVIGVGIETQKIFDKAVTYWWQVDTSFPKNSTILIKGSQNTIFLEELVKSLLQNKSDIKYLCRQSPYWLKLKNNFKTKANNSFGESTK